MIFHARINPSTAFSSMKQKSREQLMQRTAASLVCLAMLSGCATINKQPLDAKTSTSMKGQTVTHTVRSKPDFAAMTAGKAAFAMIGAFAMISEGNSIIEKNKVADPADAIAVGLAKALEASHGSKLVSSPVAIAEDDPVEIVAASKGSAKYVIDARTINWNFAYFPTDWTHYRVIYSAKARLIDAETSTVVAEGFCKRVPEYSEKAPTYDELLADEAALLKKELVAAADECVKSLKSEMLSL